MTKSVRYLLPILVVLFLLLIGCGSKSPGSTSTSSTTAPQNKFDEKAAIAETKVVVKSISEDISSGSTEKVLAQLEASARLQMSDLDLASPEAKQLAQAIADAKVTRTLPNMVFYESALGSETITFYIIKEDGVWKLGGF